MDAFPNLIDIAGVKMTILALILFLLIFFVLLGVLLMLKEIKEANGLAANHKIRLLASIQKAIEDIHFSIMDVKETVESSNLELTSSMIKIEQTLSALEGAVETIAAHPAFSVSVSQDSDWSDCIPDY